MTRWTSRSAFVCRLSLLVGCTAAAQAVEQEQISVPLYSGMGDHHREVTTSAAMAQRYFDQGLVWAYAFNHDEAIRSFQAAAQADPDCAMAWWGIALSNGPHINNPVVPPDRAKAAWEALQKAVALKDKTTPTERGLIDALSSRYADP